MPLTNTPDRYGAVTKSFHWIIALLILTIIPLGLIAHDLADAIADPDVTATDSAVSLARLLFTLHKTLGVTIFFLALARILWALGQPRPGLINGDRPLEAWLASTVHWLLYGSLVAVPLSGWVAHAASTGFAPIWWPLGQGLPFVPKDPAWAGIAEALHYILQWVLIGAVTLHVAGALKHHLIDRDATLRRMLPGGGRARPTARQPGHFLPFVTALAVWGAAVGVGLGLGWFSRAERQAAPSDLAAVASEWQVTSGTLGIAIRQMGAEVSGNFADWTAEISYDENADGEGLHGAVEVTVSIPSLSLGAVTDQAMGADFLAAGTHPTARYTADLVDRGAGLVAEGTLTIRDRTRPLSIPVALEIRDDTALASGMAEVDRRDFGIGDGVTDEDSLGFGVEIAFELTATRR